MNQDLGSHLGKFHRLCISWADPWWARPTHIACGVLVHRVTLGSVQGKVGATIVDLHATGQLWILLERSWAEYAPWWAKLPERLFPASSWSVQGSNPFAASMCKTHAWTLKRSHATKASTSCSTHSSVQVHRLLRGIFAAICAFQGHRLGWWAIRIPCPTPRT